MTFSSLQTVAVVVGIVAALISIIGVIMRILWPKIELQVKEGAILSDISKDHPAEIVFHTELLLKLAVLNKRRWQTPVTSWSAKVVTAAGTIEAQPFVIPNEYVVSRPGFRDGSQTQETEWPINDLRALTAHAFDQASGWLRFYLPDMSAEVKEVTVAATTAIHLVRTRYRFKWKPTETNLNVWDTSDPKQRACVNRFYGPKP